MFNVRVYGILINDHNQVLLSDEYISGKYYTKFPGGGLEIGEGTRDCLAREFKEELNLQIEVNKHIYTTDFYQQSAFNPAHQIISIYYYVKALGPIVINPSGKPFDFSPEKLAIYENTNKIETFRFVDLAGFTPGNVSFPIDKLVVQMII